MKISAFMLMASMALIGTAPISGALVSPIRDNQTAVIFPPGWSKSDVISDLPSHSARIIRFGRWSNIAIIELNARQQDFLQQSGALFLLDPEFLGGCLTAQTNAQGTI